MSASHDPDDRDDEGAAGRVIHTFTRPTSVTVIGPSTNPETLTHRPIRYLSEWGFPGRVVAVNPRASGPIAGFPTVPTLGEAPPAELALILLPADQVHTTVAECIERGYRGAIVIASGFEGDEGEGRRRMLNALIEDHPEFRLVGPNCNGVLSIANRAPFCFSSVLLQNTPPLGHLGLVTQSGAIGNGLLLALHRRGVGLAHWFSTGDELDLGALEIATAMLEDEQCSAVGMFLEAITDSEWLEPLARAIARSGKPVVAMRTAASGAGRAAAFGHTGRVIGRADIARAALRDAGVTLIDDIDEFAGVLTTLGGLGPHADATPTNEPLAVGVVTVSGGSGVIAADAIAHAGGLRMADLTSDTKRTIEERLPGVHPANPLDVPTLASTEAIITALRVVAEAPEVQAVIGVVTSIAHDYELIARDVDTAGKPVIITHLSPEEGFDALQARRLVERGALTVPSAVHAVRGLDTWAGSGGVRRPSPADHTEHEKDAAILGLDRSAVLLGSGCGGHLAPYHVVAGEDAVEAARGLARPVAMKAEGSIIPHRSDVGALALNLVTDEDIRNAHQRLRSICEPVGEQIIVQAMAEPGLEIMLSLIRDPEVGVVAILRTGGVATELTGDSVILVGSPENWALKLAQTPLGRRLDGWRGSPKYDGDALLGIAEDIWAVMHEKPQLRAVECNPVIVMPDGAVIVDMISATAQDPAREENP